MPVREIEKDVRSYIDIAETTLNDFGIYPRVAPRYPFEIVALATLSKAFALSKACLELLKSNLCDEAHGLSRSLVECATNLRYLTADPNLQDRRTRDFVNYSKADKSYWLHYALEQFGGRAEEREIREYAQREGIVADPKAARRHWSGLTGFIWEVALMDHPTTTPTNKKAAYAFDYHETSAYVHCSVPAIESYFVEEKTLFQVSHSIRESKKRESTLFLVPRYLDHSIKYTLFGMNMVCPDELEHLVKKILSKIIALRP